MIRTLSRALSVALFAAALWATLIEPGRLVIVEQTLDLPQWTRPPVRIAVLADLHAGAPHVSLARVGELVDITNAQRPDLVVLLGDFAASVLGAREVAPADLAAALAGFSTPLGTYAVLGNHDWWRDGQGIWDAFAAEGIQVLDNRAAPVRDFWLAGVEDPMTRTPNLRQAIMMVPPTAPLLLLCHSPDIFPQVPPRVALTLAGHTHGGQVRLPLIGAPMVPSKYGQRYVRGHIREGSKDLYVSSGIGTSIAPVRLGVPPEIVILTLE